MYRVDQWACLHFVDLSHTATGKSAVVQKSKCDKITASAHRLLRTKKKNKEQRRRTKFKEVSKEY